MKNELLAICLKTYPDEDDMEKFVEGHIEAFEVKIYYKGEQYLVTKYFDEKYYKLLETES